MTVDVMVRRLDRAVPVTLNVAENVMEHLDLLSAHLGLLVHVRGHDHTFLKVDHVHILGALDHHLDRHHIHQFDLVLVEGKFNFSFLNNFFQQLFSLSLYQI